MPLQVPAVLAQTNAPCMMVDVSEGGARLRLERFDDVPPAFDLFLTPGGGVRRACRVVWRDGPFIGVQFAREAAAERHAAHLVD